MAERYDFAYGRDTVYERVVGLVKSNRRPDGEVVLDIGCGFGPIAELVSELGLTYLGVDIETDGLRHLQDRGFTTIPADMSRPEEALTLIGEHIKGQTLAAIVATDFIDHTTNCEDILRALRHLSLDHGSAPMVVSVPNVTHFDLATKILLGRWDITPTGILDETQVSLFSPSRLRQLTERCGWLEVARDDFELSQSDQHYPSEVATLAPDSPLRNLLFQVRNQAAEGAIVNQFVRAYIPSAKEIAIENGGKVGDAPFLSVLVRTQGRRPVTLDETLLSLAAQTSSNFEVLLLAHDVAPEPMVAIRMATEAFGAEFANRVRVVDVAGGNRSRPLNIGLQLARGKYVAVLDDDDVAFAHWVEVFEKLAFRHPGTVLRSIVADQSIQSARWGERKAYEVVGKPEGPWPERFDLLDHLECNATPFCGCAFPRSCFTDLGIRFDETLPVWEDWDVLLQAVSWCGVIDSGEVTSLYRRWEDGGSSLQLHTAEEWERTREMVWAKLDMRPLLLPPQTLSALLRMREDGRHLREASARVRESEDRQAEALSEIAAERDQLRLAAENASLLVDELRSSTSWRMTAPIRVAGGLGRRLFARRRPATSSR